MPLEDYGWDPMWQFYVDAVADADLVPGRLATVDRGQAVVITDQGPRPASWRYPVAILEEPEGVAPAVGDWALLSGPPESSAIQVLLPRRTLLARGTAKGSRVTQPLAANVDLVVAMTALDGDFSLRRIERFLALARSGSARALVVLSKADLRDESDEELRRAHEVAPGVDVLTVSAVTGQGVEALENQLGPGRTAVLVGSSGVGKSTLINRLLGEERQRTGSVRASDDRGRHVTTRCELLPLSTGGLIIDTPGLREVGLLADEQALREVFPEIAALAERCRFGDCRHLEEPGCAVRQAMETGELLVDRVDSYQRLVRELDSAERRESEHLRRAHERATVGHYRRWLREVHRFKGRNN